ncbi:MAG: MBL fold metallo-hydrolase [Bacteroidales bacterium]|nr:MBL fold metallo-hydrolase [Bacteroidales bacterium]
MSLYLASLNSGSNGNCYYIGNSHDAVLIDAGISCRETERRMARLGLSIRKVRAIFISHEHRDHIRGVEVLSRKHGIPVYMSPITYLKSQLRPDSSLPRTFITQEPVHVGSLTVHPLPKQHDAADPHSYTVTSAGITAGIFTDIGRSCEQVAHHFGCCHAAFLEANYDETMLLEGSYPLYLKRRIHGDLGHLSNRQALEIFTGHRSPFLKLLLLSHLSAHNNRPEIVSGLFAPQANGTQIAIASRYEESELYCISG